MACEKRYEKHPSGPKGQMICRVYVRAKARTYQPRTFSPDLPDRTYPFLSEVVFSGTSHVVSDTEASFA
jgi:hypothetical protein